MASASNSAASSSDLHSNGLHEPLPADPPISDVLSGENISSSSNLDDFLGSSSHGIFRRSSDSNKLGHGDLLEGVNIGDPVSPKAHSNATNSGNLHSLGDCDNHEPCNFSTNGVSNGNDNKGSVILGRNMQYDCLSITEPDIDDDSTGDREAYMASVLARYRRTLVDRTKYHLGYPYNLDFDYGALAQLQHFSINNLGDPFIESNYGVHSRQFEVGVLDWFARLWELEKEEYWGYITNCGTEGNLHGILVGREVFPDGILYASSESHYSVFKAARMYRMDMVKVDTLITGEIDCADLKRKLEERKDKPAILNVNIGTTVKGAVDDLDLVIATLQETGFGKERFFIHCDGALFGLMMPFVQKAPKVTFKKPIGSVSVSGHKFVGCPMPCGVQITRIEHINVLSRNVEYLASRDATIMGSRNGHAPIFLWYTLNRKGYRGFQKEVQKCLRNAHYLKDRLRNAGFGVMLNVLSSTVVFERPQEEAFVRKWQLACEGDIAHAVVMPNVTREKLDKFVEDLIESRLRCTKGGKLVVPCIAKGIGEENCACDQHRSR
ncbi:hypothetical protein KP509_24G027200 [Ceratopteris richardii]|uniref:Serine decarboxylase n=1 Tax=Ceratopteris richardii TaxID=49495 RepID=A0A8T2RW25_CERRI|nr:hypothetical protein KP509_24G027200 [Ceratopteris richardii]